MSVRIFGGSEHPIQSEAVSWRDRGAHPGGKGIADGVFIVPDVGRNRGNLYTVWINGQIDARFHNLQPAKDYVDAEFAPTTVSWRRIEGDQTPHYDPVWGKTKEFNDAAHYYMADLMIGGVRVAVRPASSIAARKQAANRTVYRGLHVSVDIATGDTPDAVGSRIMGQVAQHSRSGPFPGSGMGLHWSASKAAAERFAAPYLGGQISVQPSVGSALIPVIITAQVDDADRVSDPGDLARAKVEGYGTATNNSAAAGEDEIMLTPGASVRIESVKAYLPADWDTFATALHPPYEGLRQVPSMPAEWRQISGGMTATAAIDRVEKLVKAVRPGSRTAGDYRGNHQPPNPGADTPSIDRLGEAMPDVYAHPNYYAHPGQDGYSEAVSAMFAAEGNPGAQVTIYRALPSGYTRIFRGDWVTTSLDYARAHAMHPSDPEQDLPVISATVDARDVYFGGNDFIEFGYWGGTAWARTAHLARTAEYRGRHQPDNPADGEAEPLWDLGSVYMPKDVYDKPWQYPSGDLGEVQGAMRSTRGKPDATVTIYRSCPVTSTSIESGNWVSTSLTYVRSHGDSGNAGGEWHIIAADVKARDVYLGDGNSMAEYGYWGPTVTSRQITSVHAIKRTASMAEMQYRNASPRVMVNPVMDGKLMSRWLGPAVDVPWQSDLSSKIREAGEQFKRTQAMFVGMASEFVIMSESDGKFLILGTGSSPTGPWRSPRALNDSGGGSVAALAGIVDIRDETKQFGQFCEQVVGVNAPSADFHDLQGQDPKRVTVYRGIGIPAGSNPATGTHHSGGVGDSWSLNMDVAKAIAERGGAGGETDQSLGREHWQSKPMDAVVMRAVVDVTGRDAELYSDGRMRYRSEVEVKIRRGASVNVTGYQTATRRARPDTGGSERVTFSWPGNWAGGGTRTAASGGTIWRGVRIKMPPGVAELLTTGYADMDEYNQWKSKGGKSGQASQLILDFLASTGPSMGSGGIGLHWTDRREFAAGAAWSGHWELPVLLEATYTAADVVPEGDPLYKERSVWVGNQSESEVFIKPGAQLSITALSVPFASDTSEVLGADQSTRVNIAGTDWANILQRPQRRTAAWTPTPGATIYRGLQIDLPLTGEVEKILAPYMTFEEREEWEAKGGRAKLLGPIILDFMERNTPSHGQGVGIHWTESQSFAEIAADTSATRGVKVVIAATYSPSDVVPEGDPLHRASGVWTGSPLEMEVLIKPGAQLNITAVHLHDPWPSRMSTLRDKVTGGRGGDWYHVLASPQRRTAADENNDSAMVALIPPDAITGPLMDLDLTTEDRDEQHVTVLYLGKAEDLDSEAVHTAVEEWASKASPVKGTVTGLDTFNNDETVIYAAWDIQDGQAWQDTLRDALDDAGVNYSDDYPEWTAHQTLSFTEDDPDLPDLPDMPTEAVFGSVVVAYAGEWTTYALGGAQRTASTTINYARNTEKSPNAGDQYEQDIEPHGRYMIDAEGGTFGSRWQRGTITFANPLRIEAGEYRTPSSWKRVLADRYGKTGRALSRAIVADGYDGIITSDKYGTGEIVDLQGWDA